MTWRPNRRSVIAAMSCLLAAGPTCPSTAQTARRARLGYLSGGMNDENAANTIGVLRDGLSQLGWRIDDTLLIDERWANGEFATLPRLATELLAAKPDILVATGATEAKALQAATQTIPIVFMQVSVDAVSAGLVKRIAR